MPALPDQGNSQEVKQSFSVEVKTTISAIQKAKDFDDLDASRAWAEDKHRYDDITDEEKAAIDAAIEQKRPEIQAKMATEVQAQVARASYDTELDAIADVIKDLFLEKKLSQAQAEQLANQIEARKKEINPATSS